MPEPLDSTIQPPLVTGADRPYTLADACIDRAKQILIHAETCPQHIFRMERAADGDWPSRRVFMRISCSNCGGAELLPLEEEYTESWRARAADEAASIKAVVIGGYEGKVES